MKLSFSLSKPKASAPPPALSRPSAFGTGDDDDTNDSPSTLPSSDGKTSVNKVTLAQNVQASKAMKKKMEEEKQVDATVYEYDEVWDKMQEAKLKAKVAKEQESKERKVRHLGCASVYPPILTPVTAKIHSWLTFRGCDTQAGSLACRREDDAA